MPTTIGSCSNGSESGPPIDPRAGRDAAVKDLEQALCKRRAAGLYRSRRAIDSPQGPVVQRGGRELLSFCSNDYLGLAVDPRLVCALQDGAARWGVGSGAAHLINGYTAAHRALEEELADFLERPRALLFSTGYMANLGVVSALVGRGDQVLEDRLNHASLLDAGLASGARFARFRHRDTADLKRRIDPASGERLIATDAVFSMDGDVAPLPVLARTARSHDAWLMVDDAHGFGMLGREGRGAASEFGLSVEDAPILMATFGKAVGTFGAFVAGSEALIETLIQQARTYVYTTAPPAAVAEATRVALRIVRDESWRRERLQTLIARFRAGAQQLGLPVLASNSAIQPLLIGDSAAALQLALDLEQAGLLVVAIRPPTVPAGGARLRITLSAAHQDAHVDLLLDALASARAIE